MIITACFWHMIYFSDLKKNTVSLLHPRYFKALFQLFQNYQKRAALPVKIYVVSELILQRRELLTVVQLST